MLPVYCIHLPQAVERRTAMEALARTHGVTLTWIEAVSGKSLDAAAIEQSGYQQAARGRSRGDLTANEIACFLSHRQALTTFLASGQPHGIVLEDDAMVVDTFWPRIEPLLRMLSGWDLIKLECRTPTPQGYRITETQAGQRVFATTRASLGATGILYSRQGASNVLASMAQFQYAIDTHIGFGWKQGLRMLEVFPSIVCERPDAPACTGDRRSSAERRGGLGGWWRVRSERLVHSVMKRVGARQTQRRVRVHC